MKEYLDLHLIFNNDARRDIDAFSFEFAQTPQQPASPVNFQSKTNIYICLNYFLKARTIFTFAKNFFLKARVAPPEHDERPDRGYCQKVPQSVCAVAYDRYS